MNKNSTLTGKVATLLAIFILTFISGIQAGASNGGGTRIPAPKFKFVNPVLVSGVHGQVGAKYLFTNVYENKDAYITIENIVGGAVLKDIDNTTTGYNEAWQPTVGGPGTYGSSYIKWNIEFDSAGVPYTFSLIDLSAVDVDGDNVRVRELSGIVGGQFDYNLPDSIVPSLLTISTLANNDDIFGTDAGDSVLMALGPVANRAAIDTLSLDVRIDYKFTNRSGFQIYTGSQVDNNGNMAAIETDRFHSIYFGDLIGTYNVLAIKYQSFNALWNNSAVDLKWSISDYVTDSHFEVTRSFDQADFSTAGIVLGAQSVNNGTSQYAFTDVNKEILNHTTVYYRLKQVNSNGTYSYSEVKAVHISKGINQSIAVSVMPNPYMDKLKVNFESQNAGKAEIRMISAAGTTVKKLASTINKGTNSVELGDLSSQRPGMYVVNIIVNGESIGSQKIIKN